MQAATVVKGLAGWAALGGLLSEPVPAAPPNGDEAAVATVTLPDALAGPDGEPVATAEAWRAIARPHQFTLLEKFVYGRRLPAVPVSVVGPVERADVELAEGVEAVRLQARLQLGQGAEAPTTDVLLYLPQGHRSPVFLNLNFKGNQAETADPAVPLCRAWLPDDEATGVVGNRATEASRSKLARRWPVAEMVRRGYGMATACYGDVFPDRPDGRADSALGSLGRPVEVDLPPDEPGAIATWAWQLSRILDWLFTLPEVDPGRVIVVGHSRNGKAALWAGACDERFAMVVSNESGCGGAALERRNFGERIADFADRTVRGRDALTDEQHDTPPAATSRPAAADEFRPVQEPLQIEPPAGSILLFGDGSEGPPKFVAMDGGSIDWQVENGALVVKTSRGHANHIHSTVVFRDADMHAGFIVDKAASGNSGLSFHGLYEMQIFDSFGVDPPTDHDEASLYRFAKPLVNASRPAGEWQVYDIRYTAPRRDAAGKVTRPGTITARLNGQLVQDGVEFTEARSPYIPYRHGVTDHLRAVKKRLDDTGEGPLFLQDHGSPTRFRNVWIVPR